MDLYYMDLSPPCRAVMLTARALGLELNKKVVNLLEKEHLKEEFIKLNPQHKVPTFVEGDFVLCESRAIQAYLVNKYSKDDSLYPKDPVARAKVDSMLHFDNGTLFAGLYGFLAPVAFNGEKPDPAKRDKLVEAIEYLEGFLKGQDFVAGNQITLADHSIVATVTSIKEDGTFDVKNFPNIAGWLQRCEKQMPGYEEENAVGAKRHGEILGPMVAI